MNNGGPTESIVHNVCGFLCSPEPQQVCEAMRRLVEDRHLATEMGIAGYQRVQDEFSLQAFSKKIDQIIKTR